MFDGKKLRAARQKIGLSQGDLGKKAGCTTSTVNRIEFGVFRPKANLANRLATVLNIKMEDLQTAENLIGELPEADKTSVMVLWSTVPLEKRDIAFALATELLTQQQYQTLCQRLDSLIHENCLMPASERPTSDKSDLTACPGSQNDPFVEMAKKAVEQTRKQETKLRQHRRKFGA